MVTERTRFASAMSSLKAILLNPQTWVFLTVIVAAVGGWASIRHRRQQAQDVKGWLMGGDSWAYFVPGRTKERKLAFFIRHAGQYPAYDVVLRIQDEQKERAERGASGLSPQIRF